MTGTLIAKLIEDGLLAWETPLSVMLEGVPMRDEYRAVTLRHLLSHRSGLPGNLPIPRLLRFPREEAHPRQSREAYVVEALAMTPHGPAEASFEYSNNGYVVAGAVIERVTGQPWEAVIQERLFSPLGMTQAGFGAPGAAGVLDQPVGHSQGLLGATAHPPGAPITDNPAVLGPAGRVHAPFSDLLRFAQAHRDQIGFLRPESWTALHTPPFGGDYAMGLVVRPDGALWHNGSNTLWYAEMLIDPVRGVVAAAAANTGAIATAAPSVGEALMAAAAAVV
jgi:CubicO group peptidase (beta-lactamase class C family)